MRAVRIEDNQARVVDVPAPDGPDDDHVVVDVATSSICGTDLGFVTLGFGGFTLGHEFAGLVDGVPHAVEPLMPCGSCGQCAAGHRQRCVGDHANLGIFVDGGLADQARVRRSALVPLPPGLDVSDACLVEPTAVAWHGAVRAETQPGQRVVVVGGGSIGLLAVAALRHLGAEVDLESRHPHQRHAGERLGAGSPSGSYDIVIDAAGSESGLARGAELATPGARIVLLGVYHGLLPAPGAVTLVKELSWVGAMAYGDHHGRREVDEAAELLARDPEIADTVITHRFGLDEAAEAFRTAADRAAGAIKVVLQP
ncbi:zinc-dependent alcohol dehydrogenase [Rhabdothermincola salaria]|uniref:zinc-dependent alcohol dehydrogenase n=1 Tax=Rhabdothermincola salaria TaxID=2903142 RepID=UPI001E618C91|nr:alcohol dehydrogenase catalytic domain-containing protein [Rhabdothermincola salaria]